MGFAGPFLPFIMTGLEIFALEIEVGAFHQCELDLVFAAYTAFIINTIGRCTNDDRHGPGLQFLRLPASGAEAATGRRNRPGRSIFQYPRPARVISQGFDLPRDSSGSGLRKRFIGAQPVDGIDQRISGGGNIFVGAELVRRMT